MASYLQATRKSSEEGLSRHVRLHLQRHFGTQGRRRATLLEAIPVCEVKKDYVSRDLLTHILDDTEDHIDFLETEIDVLGQVGLQNYLQSQYKAAE